MPASSITYGLFVPLRLEVPAVTGGARLLDTIWAICAAVTGGARLLDSIWAICAAVTGSRPLTPDPRYLGPSIWHDLSLVPVYLATWTSNLWA